jgi:hypothetical protein
MKYKRTKLIAMGTLLLLTHANAQFKLPVNNALRSDVQKLVAEFPHQFQNLKGDELEVNPQSVEYASLLKIDKAEECSIIRYSANKKPMYSWHAVMLSTEDFEEAAKKYKWIYNQLKGMNVTYTVDKYTLKGTFEAPEESRKFMTSVLTVIAPPTPLQKLKIEVSMNFEFPEWKVTLDVFEKEKEDKERGEIED